ncbi:MAG TPA: O-antigen ligase family protein [Patescibacteria group bacterium]|nr:O-antigen ligase family protein [Patescibacteria group bacterium]
MVKNIFNKYFYLALAVFALTEIASFIVFVNPWLRLVALAIILLAVLVLAIKQFEYGIYILWGELIIGGLGYLFFADIFGFRLSIRLGLFSVVFLIWLYNLIFKNKWSTLKNQYNFLILVMILIIGLGVVLGILSDRQLIDIFFDANGFLYLLLVGAFILANIKLKRIVQILLTGSLIFAVKTIAILFIFAHKLSYIGPHPIYAWIRDGGIGEITIINFPLLRIFFQSHFYNLVAFLLVLVVLFVANEGLKKKDWIWLSILLWFNFLTLVVSQSRSFWLAGALGMLVIFVYLIIAKIGWKKIIIYICIFPVLVITTHGAINLIISDFRINLFSSRLGQSRGESAISSRGAQINPILNEIKRAPFVGYGFAKTITYQSSDPRVRTEENPAGWLTTYSFELGYLDLLLKIGVLGLTILIVIIYGLAKDLYFIGQREKLLFGFLVGLVALIIVHIFTPYLNHPLGLGYLLILIGITK